MKRLKVLEQYISNRGRYGIDQVILVDDAYGEWLLRDCPSCFEEITDEPQEIVIEKEVEEPPENKMIEAPAKKKGPGRPKGS